jgi:hypothetical protein
MKHFVRITSVAVVGGTAVAVLRQAFDLDGFAWGLGNAALLLTAMLLGSLADREFFWGSAPKRQR